MREFQGYALTGISFEDRHDVVYHGVRERDGLAVNIKTSRSEPPPPETVTRLLHEYELLKGLELDAVLRVYDIEVLHDVAILILEDFAGKPLRDQIPANGMPPGVFLEHAIRLVRAIGALHEQQIIHKDLRPATILLHPVTGNLKITGFGLASRLRRETCAAPKTDFNVSDIAYVSPELTGRMNRSVDYRSDYYSMGVCFYEMLTGHPPFQAGDVLGWMHCHIAQAPEPPHQANPLVPPFLSAVVMKLLAKTAEDRYQSTHGVLSDLELYRTCSAAGTEPGDINPGQHDVADTFRISQKLYGRDQELAELLSSFERVGAGGTELVFITGHSGIGKSSLVKEIHIPVIKHRGYFISGKFDQLQRDIPYACMVQALGELVRQILTESQQSIADYRRELLAVLGNNGQVIVELVPQISLILGEQPPVTELGSTEAQNRFNLVFEDFIGVFASLSHPLVIFLDDLQWADVASLKLIKRLVSNGESRHLLLIGAYRDSEISATHPLKTIIRELQSEQAPVSTITLPPLELEHITQLACDTLSGSPQRCAPLATIIAEKSSGNPLYASEYLKTLFQKRLLWFDPLARQWQWDQGRIQSATIAESMVELIAAKLHALPEETQRVLSLAACIGNHFTLTTLGVVCEISSFETARDLWPAIQEGFVVGDSSFQGNWWDDSGYESTTFNFIHDRVQQAAYSLIGSAAKQQTHLAIGRLLLKSHAPDDRSARIFDIVNQMNAGKELIESSEERIHLAGLNLSAGEKALSSTAFESARSYLTTGLGLLGATPWQSHYELTAILCIKLLESELLCNNFEQAEKLFDEAIRYLRSPLEKAPAYILTINLCGNLGRFNESIELGRKALDMFGMRLPSKPRALSVLVQYALSRINRSKRAHQGYESISRLLELPPMSDQDNLAVMDILANVAAPSYLADKNLFAYIAMSMVNLSLKSGNTHASAFAYALYGMMIAEAFGDVAGGYEFGTLALKLIDRQGELATKGKTAFVFYNFIAHRVRPFNEGAAALAGIFQDCLRGGDLIYAGYSLLARLLHLTVMGATLDDIRRECESSLDFLERARNEDALLLTRVIRQISLCLQGSTASRGDFSDNRYDETEQVALLKGRTSFVPLQGYYQFKAQALYLMGDRHGAREMAEASHRLIEAAACQSFLSDHYLFHSLALTATLPPRGTGPFRQAIRQLKKNLKKLEQWARHCPANFRHKHLLVSAEYARITGNTAMASALCREAAESAATNGFVQMAGLAYERAADACLAAGDTLAAGSYLSKAHTAYSVWGATAKVHLLEEAFPDLCPKPSDEQHPAQHGTDETDSSLDLVSVIKLTQAISGEMLLDNLLRRFMNIVLENAGASRGVLLLMRSNRLLAEAEVDLARNIDQIRQSQPFEGNMLVPDAIINYVVRTHEHVVLDDAPSSETFGYDPYIIEHGLKSVLCVPIFHQGILNGVLYLENNLTAGAFTRDRVEVLELLSSQIAISIQNAVLYNNLSLEIAERSRAEEALKQERENLEAQVIARTAQLNEAHQKLQIHFEELKLSQEVLLRNEEEFRMAFEGVTDAIFWADAQNGIIIKCNRAAEELMETPRVELVGRHFSELHPPDIYKYTGERFRQTTTTLGKAISTETEILTKSGRRVPVQIKHAVTRIGSRDVIQGIFRDTTERDFMQNELIKSQKLESIGVLAGGIAHNFNNALTGILGYISIANKHLDKSSKPSQLLEKAELASKRASEMARQLLTFSRGGAPAISSVQVKQLVEESISLTVTGKNVRALVDIPDSLAAIKADEGQMVQAFNNLLINAVQAMPGGGTVSIRAENVIMDTTNLFNLPAGRYVRLEFADQGCGISSENLNNIFVPYFTTKAEVGTGLGLATVHSIVSRHGGSISVNSELGRGSRFTIHLPASDTTTLDNKLIPDRREQPAYSASLGTVLIMDDEELIRELAKETLEFLGYRVTACCNGEEALAAYRQALEEETPYYCVILDLTIPDGMGGRETAEHLLALDPLARLIVSTGYSNDPIVSTFQTFGFCAAMIKPYTADELFQVLHMLDTSSSPLPQGRSAADQPGSGALQKF